MENFMAREYRLVEVFRESPHNNAITRSQELFTGERDELYHYLEAEVWNTN